MMSPYKIKFTDSYEEYLPDKLGYINQQICTNLEIHLFTMVRLLILHGHKV